MSNIQNNDIPVNEHIGDPIDIFNDAMNQLIGAEYREDRVVLVQLARDAMTEMFQQLIDRLKEAQG